MTTNDIERWLEKRKATLTFEAGKRLHVEWTTLAGDRLQAHVSSLGNVVHEVLAEELADANFKAAMQGVGR